MSGFRFPKNERLKSKKLFHQTLLFGNKLYSSSKKLKCSFLIIDYLDSNFKAAFVVGKRSGKAYWRNRVKRILRECFRLNKHSLIPLLVQKNKTLSIIFISNKLNEREYKNIKYSDLLPDFLELLEMIENELKTG